MRKAISLVWVSAFSLAGCDGSQAPPVITRTDSSGVEIVTSHTSGSPTPVWRVSRRPELEIGALDGPDELTFGNIRAVGRMPDGRIYVGDEDAHVVRVYSERGEYEGFFGGEGQGPGELQWFLTVRPYRGDSVFVYDYAGRAVSVFGADLRFGRRFTNPIRTGNYWIVDALPDGRFLATSPGRSFFPGERGLFADSSHVVLVAADGGVADTVGSYVVKMEHLDEQGRPEPSFLHPWGRALIVGDNLAWVEGERFELVIATSAGDPIRILRKPEPRAPVTSEVREEFRRAYLELGGQNPEAPQERIRRILDEGHYPDVLPALSPEVHVDALGYIWIPRYHFGGRSASEWEVFDSTGVWVGPVPTPEDFDVHQIGASEIIGVRRGEFDVPYVQVYGLRRE